MNYRHAFHAGNFADVIKHIVLARILTYLHEKPAAFRVIDTHAGAGLYDLTSSEAERGGEWRTGIARLMQARLSDQVMALVAPYLDIVRAFNPQRDLTAYPGSPLVARALLRPQDRLVACELEPNARKQLMKKYCMESKLFRRQRDASLAHLTPDEIAMHPRGHALLEAP